MRGGHMVVLGSSLSLKTRFPLPLSGKGVLGQASDINSYPRFFFKIICL